MDQILSVQDHGQVYSPQRK